MIKKYTLPILFIILGVFTLAGFSSEAASSTVYVDPSGSCGGKTPCYVWMSDALGNVSDGGTVIVTSNSADNIISPATAQNITIKGENPGITLTGGVNVTAGTVVGWTIQDLNFTGGFLIEDISSSLTVQNISTTGMTLGYFPQDITADISILNNQLPDDDGSVISILGDSGNDINGSITIQGNTGVDAINIFTYVASTGSADLNADISIDGNSLRRGANIGVDSLGGSGIGDVTGEIVFSNNSMGDKIGLTINGEASGDFLGPVTFSYNTGLWIALLTIDSAIGGNIEGSVTLNGNDIEFIEITAKGLLSGIVSIDGNNVTDKVGGVSQGPTIQVDAYQISGNVTIQNTTGSVAYLSTRSRTADLAGQVHLKNNAVGWIEIDSQGGAVSSPFEIMDNQLPTNPLPGSPLGDYSFITVHTGSSGNLFGGTFSGNTMDRLQFDIDGSLTNELTIATNEFRDYVSLISKAPGTSPGIVTFSGNYIPDISYFDGFTTTASFNRHLGMMTVVPGTSVSADNNWWGCNHGPGESGCPTIPTSPTVYSPWLTFNASTTCTSPSTATVNFDLLKNSDDEFPSNNSTPGVVDIYTSIGSVSVSPVDLVNGVGSTNVSFPMGSSPTITVQLDSENLVLNPICTPARDGVGTFRPSIGVHYLKNYHGTGYADIEFSYGLPTDLFFSGDWDGDGVDTIGNFRDGVFYLRNSNTTGYADLTFAYGVPGDIPIAGDWDGDGVDTIGVFRNGVFYLRNSNTTGYADITLGFGVPGDTPISGDWNGDDIDTIGTFRDGVFYLRNSNTTGYAEITFGYGIPGDLIITGDWDDDGIDTVGTFRNGIVYVRNSNTSGYADITFGFGLSGDLPLAGDWDGLP
jgi:hypothetical protein